MDIQSNGFHKQSIENNGSIRPIAELDPDVSRRIDDVAIEELCRLLARILVRVMAIEENRQSEQE